MRIYIEHRPHRSLEQRPPLAKPSPGARPPSTRSVAATGSADGSAGDSNLRAGSHRLRRPCGDRVVADGLAVFPADALILSVHAPDVANWRERRFRRGGPARFELPVTEMLLDREGRVISVASE